jgi:hypothetical protein
LEAKLLKLRNIFLGFVLLALTPLAAFSQISTSGVLSEIQDRVTGVTAGTYTCPTITVDTTGRITGIASGTCSGVAFPALQFRPTWLLSGSGTYTTDANFIAGWVELKAPGGAGGSVYQTNGSVAYGGNAGNIVWDACTAEGGKGGGTIGDQGRGGGIIGVCANPYLQGAAGDGYGDSTGGRGGGARGAHATWQMSAEQGPNGDGGGGTGAPGPPKPDGSGYWMAATGGGEGGWIRMRLTPGSHTYSIGTPGMPVVLPPITETSNPGRGYTGSQGAQGSIMLMILEKQ